MIEGEPEDKDGDARVLEARLDGDGGDVLDGAAGQPSDGAAEGEAEPGQRHPHHDHLPRHQLEDVEVGPHAHHQDEEQQAERQRLQDAHQERRHAGQVARDEQPDGQRHDEGAEGDEDLVVGDDDVVGVDEAAQAEDPERHHGEGGEAGDGGHGEREVEVAAEHEGPHVAAAAARRGPRHEEAEAERVVGGEGEADGEGDERHQEELAEEADQGADRAPESLLDDPCTEIYRVEA